MVALTGLFAACLIDRVVRLRVAMTYWVFLEFNVMVKTSAFCQYQIIYLVIRALEFLNIQRSFISVCE